jgi:hypothetical protein
VKEKEKKTGRRRGLARGGFDGLLGRLARKEGRVSFVFFCLFSFSISFQNNL